MKVQALVLLGATVVAATACDSSRGVVEDTSTAASTAENTLATEPVSFTKELTQGNARFEIRTTGSAAQRQLTIRSYRGAALTSDPVRLDINGAVRDAVTADLNGNGKPEVYIFTDAASANGGFYGYEFAERGYTPISGPGNITGTAGVGYGGKDTYTLANNMLSRTFPVSSNTASTTATEPTTGGSRTITYTLDPTGKWVMGQVMEGQP
ncbi:hypothetical protein J0X19_13330 [Hymenobacter sp. BT186]|uniref:Uncharacterized protein n=1 Tax=Hymenobacter telluris TaxID=2816474 RepID=A0A939EW60_9BACT|nr:hypothetical protein [Hymenobacter telluris]MBO0358934.1 hypothetical protein [Hymenobacter telluris]MBW3374960.1 hypothetical protein [Hymenobacter norwichensis]